MTKIALFIVLLYTVAGCNAIKRVPDDKLLLMENTIDVNGTRNKLGNINNIPYQQPNNRVPLFTAPLRLYIYNWARPNIDSILHARAIEDDATRKFWTAVLSRKQLDRYIETRIAFNEALKSTGEAPTVISESLTQRSAERLDEYYKSNGWFNAETAYSIDTLSYKRGKVDYNVTTGQPYILDSLKTFIQSAEVDSIYKRFENQSFISQGEQYKRLELNAEARRLTTLFRNNGMFHFDQEFISFIGDTVNTGQKVNLELYIKNRQIKAQDSVYQEELKVHHISTVKVYTDYTYAQRNDSPKDTMSFNDYELYGFDKIEYKPRYLTNAIFIDPGDVYSDESRNKSLIRLGQLRTFKYPDLRFTEDPADSTGRNLIANFYLSPLPKFNARLNFDVSRSNIQKFGIAGGGSLLMRNVLGGMETLQLSARGSIGASATPDDASAFFDITELGVDLNFTLPRIFFPIRTGSFITPEMAPSTSFTSGLGVQQNIGLDKQNLTAGIDYRWNPTTNVNYRFDLLDIQYIRNLNTSNYFNVYSNSYDNLNEIARNNLTDDNPLYGQAEADTGLPRLSIPDGALGFINQVENGSINVANDELLQVNRIEERRDRLTEDNLILASSITYLKNTRQGIFDEEFTSFRARLELAGNLLSLAADELQLGRDANGDARVFGVTFSQYTKAELTFIKHWDFQNDNILAIRAFGGIAIPYGNSNSIPFIRSFFGGGANDNRAWQAYRLGPGSTNSPNEFNEANMKLAFNVEQRFSLLGDLKGALFADVGNIWNVLDNVQDPRARFNDFKSLEDIAVGSGFGLRYDFNFFVLRFDVGFKTYNPALDLGNRWFRNYNFGDAVFNVGINYPF
ncbi:BamA/TamA family outer membrane protein [Flavimarina sp. Hel_I_48]|uniref:translocation and assembly module lipoprotein TamL n=1 Tax=Flavimarina sp. Hel_I_48 TaxID=1392488 RepID=UPI0029352E06|nr:BamA/TamA family outer membrane protein [Flavimarina sp. Hel_I_48]